VTAAALTAVTSSQQKRRRENQKATLEVVVIPFHKRANFRVFGIKSFVVRFVHHFPKFAN
jgi:hypothetical protein